MRSGREVFTLACDISDRNGVTAMLESVTRHYGHIDILVNNAGEITVSPFENLQAADFEHAMAVMFWGTLYATFGVLLADEGAGPRPDRKRYFYRRQSERAAPVELQLRQGRCGGV